MADIYDCADCYFPLLDTRYHIILGRKGISTAINLNFNKNDCFHLMGLQYLDDRPELRRDRGIIFDEIYKRKIKKEHIETSHFYSQIRDRIHFFPFLESVLDSNDTIFKYNNKINTFSLIQAEYLLKNKLEDRNLFLFLSKSKEGDYFCRSFFPENKYDYSKNQASWTLLYKSKIKISTKEEQILYNRLRDD